MLGKARVGPCRAGGVFAGCAALAWRAVPREIAGRDQRAQYGSDAIR
jgi:hypothetical protein